MRMPEPGHKFVSEMDCTGFQDVTEDGYLDHLEKLEIAAATDREIYGDALLTRPSAATSSSRTVVRTAGDPTALSVGDDFNGVVYRVAYAAPS